MKPITPKQAEALWTLVAGGGQGRKPAAAAAPEELLAEGMIQTGYRGAGKTALAELTDRGWAWANDNFGDEAATPKPLLPWFTLIKAFLDAKGLSLADLVVTMPEQLSPTPAKPAKAPAKPRTAATPKAPGKPKAAPKPKAAAKAPTAAQMRKRIEQAYLAVTGGRKAEAAPLSALRAELADLDRTVVDAGLLRILQGDPKASLGQFSDPRALTGPEREAAFSPGGEPFHLLWIKP